MEPRVLSEAEYKRLLDAVRGDIRDQASLSFCSNRSSALRSGTASCESRVPADQDGIPNASVHTLRHTFATHTIKKGTKLEVVRQALGHESLETTSAYIHLAREMMDKEMHE